MRTVEDADGNRLLLVKQSGKSSLVRDPDTGDTRYLPNENLTPVDGESPLATAARSVPEPARVVLSASRDDRSLGLLVELVETGPLSVRHVLDAYDLCESDVHGIFGEFRAAGLVTETRVAGERGYQATPTAEEAVGYLTDRDESLAPEDGD